MCLTSTESIRLIRDGEKGGGKGGGGDGMEVGGRGRLNTYRYTVTTQDDSCIKMGSDESHFNASLIVRDKVTIRQCPQITTFLKRKESRGEICLPA